MCEISSQYPVSNLGLTATRRSTRCCRPPSPRAVSRGHQAIVHHQDIAAVTINPLESFAIPHPRVPSAVPLAPRYVCQDIRLWYPAVYLGLTATRRSTRYCKTPIPSYRQPRPSSHCSRLTSKPSQSSQFFLFLSLARRARNLCLWRHDMSVKVRNPPRHACAHPTTSSNAPTFGACGALKGTDIRLSRRCLANPLGPINHDQR